MTHDPASVWGLRGSAQLHAWRTVMLGTVILLTTIGALALRGVGDFTHFYNAGRAVLDGSDIFASGTRGYIYPPLFAITFAPFALLPKAAAGVLWVVCNGVLLVASTIALAREVLHRFGSVATPERIWTVAALGLVFHAARAAEVLKLGQSDVVIFALIVLALTQQKQRPWLCGVALGVAVNIKYQAIAFLPYFLLRARWREAAWMVVATGAGLLSGSVIFGWARNTEYLAQAFSGLLEMAGLRERTTGAAEIHPLAWERSVSLLSTGARAAERFGWRWATIALPAIAAAGTAAIAAAMCSCRRVGIFKGRGGDRESHGALAAASLLEWVGVVSMVLVLSPQTTIRHLFLLLLGTTVAAGLLVLRSTTPGSRRPRWVLIAGLVVLIFGLVLPPGGPQFKEALTWWRAVGGPSWCVLVFLCCLLWDGLSQVPTGQSVKT